MVTCIFDNIPSISINLTRKFDPLAEKVTGKVLKNFFRIIKELRTSSRLLLENEKLGITKNTKLDVLRQLKN